ncbi:DUF2971 domain-containing protein [Ferrovibrio sp.]|uniref:DUF2971 domain-containing protein n=1 Tax=Ferrovibrio sp. TaxID=1917215 RepID=UPI0035AECCF7
MELPPDQEKLLQIFYPNFWNRVQKVQQKRIRFVHYTSAEVAANILKKKELWLRNASCMNDFTEIMHGLECIEKTINKSDSGIKFKSALNSTFDKLFDEIWGHLIGWETYLRTDTFLSCFSEHYDGEDAHGRLSMWRAYGGTTGVALVLKSAPFFTPNDSLKVDTSPVAYLDEKQFEDEIETITSNIIREVDFIRQRGRNEIFKLIFDALRFAALCTKHEGFREEQEWRILHCPSYAKSNILRKEIEIVRGVPQQVYKLPLVNIPKEGLFGITLPNLIDRIIIGPTAYPTQLRTTFIDLLLQAGVTEAQNKVVISGIPLR